MDTIAAVPADPASQPRTRGELASLLHLGLPLAGAQMIQVLMSITDSVMLGRLNSDALASGSLANNTVIFLLVTSFGLLASMPPLIAEARGRGDTGTPRQILRAGLCVAAGLALLIILLLLFIEPFLIRIGEPAVLAQGAGEYARAFTWGVPASLWTASYRLTLAALERPRPALLLLILGLGLNLLLNWILIFGHWGFPALGIAGSAYSTSIVNWCMVLALAAYIKIWRILPDEVQRPAGHELWRRVKDLLHLGLPIAAISAMELSFFSILSLLMGFFGTAALAAHQICMGVASLTFMVPMALGQAASVRVGFHRGAQRIVTARRTGYLALRLGVGFMICSALFMWLGANSIVELYLSDSDPARDMVLAIGHRLLLVAAVFQVFDGAQAVAAGALRGLKDTRVPMLLGAVGYCVIGLPAGVLFAFGLHFGPVGLWGGFVVGLFVTAILLTSRFALLSSRLVRNPEPSLA